MSALSPPTATRTRSRRRYASAEMSALFSARSKFTTWRRLWLWLAEAEKELGLPIPEAVARRAPRAPRADRRRARGRRPVRARDEARRHGAPPRARRRRPGGARASSTSAPRRPSSATTPTSCSSARRCASSRRRTVRVMATPRPVRARATATSPASASRTSRRRSRRRSASARASGSRTSPSTTASSSRRADELRFLGCKGATGTQASFVALFDGDADKAERLDRLVAEKAGFPDRLLDLGPDVHAQAGRPRPLGARGPRGLRLEVRERPPAPPAPQGGRGAVRQEAGRLVGDALQAEPDEVRADERPRALAPLDLGERRTGRTRRSGSSGRSTTRRTGASLSPSAFLSADAILLLWDAVADGLVVHPSVVRRRLDAGAAVPRHREHPDGGRQEGRRPAGPPREDPRPRAGRGRPA